MLDTNKVKYSLSKDEYIKMMHSLDLFSRIQIGQYEELFMGPAIRYFRDESIELHELMKKIRGHFIPKMKDRDFNTSLGIWSLETPQEAIKSYDIFQAIRYEVSYYYSPEGGITVNFNKPFIHGDWSDGGTNIYGLFALDIVINTVEPFDMDVGENIANIIDKAIEVYDLFKDFHYVDAFSKIYGKDKVIDIYDDIIKAEKIMKELKKKKYNC